MLKIRLSRVGKNNSPIFRLVVAEKTRAVKRENLEILGLYNPTNKENKFSANKERVLFWISKGAQPSETVNNLLCDFDVLPKKDKLKIVHGKAKTKKAAKEEAGKKPETLKEDVKVDTEEKEEEKVDVKEEQPVEETPSEPSKESKDNNKEDNNADTETQK